MGIDGIRTHNRACRWWQRDTTSRSGVGEIYYPTLSISKRKLCRSINNGFYCWLRKSVRVESASLRIQLFVLFIIDWRSKEFHPMFNPPRPNLSLMCFVSLMQQTKPVQATNRVRDWIIPSTHLRSVRQDSTIIISQTGLKSLHQASSLSLTASLFIASSLLVSRYLFRVLW